MGINIQRATCQISNAGGDIPLFGGARLLFIRIKVDAADDAKARTNEPTAAANISDLYHDAAAQQHNTVDVEEEERNSFSSTPSLVYYKTIANEISARWM